jgi:hypothetical protein
MYAVTDKDIKQASEDFMVALENFDGDTPTLLLDACCEVLACAEMLAIEDADRAVVERRLGRRFRGHLWRSRPCHPPLGDGCASPQSLSLGIP